MVGGLASRGRMMMMMMRVFSVGGRIDVAFRGDAALFVLESVRVEGMLYTRMRGCRMGVWGWGRRV